MTVRTHVAHDLDAIPMQDGVEVGGVGRGEGACHGVPLFPFGLGLRVQPWPSPRAGCASIKRLRKDPKSNAVFAPLRGKPRLGRCVAPSARPAGMALAAKWHRGGIL
jgi:hypothetical protein